MFSTQDVHAAVAKYGYKDMNDFITNNAHLSRQEMADMLGLNMPTLLFYYNKFIEELENE